MSSTNMAAKRTSSETQLPTKRNVRSAEAISTHSDCSLPGVDQALRFNIHDASNESSTICQIDVTNLKTKQRYRGRFNAEQAAKMTKDSMDLEELEGFVKTALAKYLIKGPEADDAIEIRACFASAKTAICTKLKDVQGRATANEMDSLVIYIEYKPAPFFKLLVPLVCFELETSPVDRLETRLDDMEAAITTRPSSGPFTGLYVKQNQNGTNIIWNPLSLHGGDDVIETANTHQLRFKRAGSYQITINASASGGNINGHQLQLFQDNAMVVSSYCSPYAGQLQWIMTVPVDGTIHVICAAVAFLPNYAATGPSATTMTIREL